MSGSSIRRVFGGLLLFASAAVLGAVLTPADVAAGDICDEMSCKDPPFYTCQPEEDHYCHPYMGLKRCWDGDCEQPE